MFLSKTITFLLSQGADFSYLIILPKYYLIFGNIFDTTCQFFSLFGTCFFGGLAYFLLGTWDAGLQGCWDAGTQGCWDAGMTSKLEVAAG